MVVARQWGAVQAVLDLLVVTLVLLRLVHVMLYLAGHANARSAVWSLESFVNV